MLACLHLFYLQKENRPLALVSIVALFVLEVLTGLEIDGMAQVIPGRSPFGSLLVDHRLSSLCHSATNEPQSM